MEAKNSTKLSCYCPKTTVMQIEKVAAHFGLSKAKAIIKLIEMGLHALGEDFQKSSEESDLGKPHIITTARKLL